MYILSENNCILILVLLKIFPKIAVISMINNDEYKK